MHDKMEKGTEETGNEHSIKSRVGAQKCGQGRWFDFNLILILYWWNFLHSANIALITLLKF